MSKQTAVEWLIEQWPILESQIPPRIIEQAKDMEDGQKIQFATEYALHIIKGGFLTPTEFYNEKFKSE
jgi:hypothetical protein